MEAIHAAQWLLQYIRCTKHMELTFLKGDMRLSTYVDASFGDVVTDSRRSTAGHISVHHLYSGIALYVITTLLYHVQ